MSLRNEPTTTNAQLLRLKRSMPAMKQTQSPSKPTVSKYDRPPSRTELSGRSQAPGRPKTPVERGRAIVESAASHARKHPVPFLPAGASHQSHNVNAKPTRSFRRHDSEHSIELRPGSRAVSRSTMRSPSPRRNRLGSQDGVWQQLSKPRRTRQFGDGHELDAFDDLPTSMQAEARFMRQPVATSNRGTIRSKVYQNILPDRTASPALYSPALSSHTIRHDSYLPSFARDTAASRIARETSLAQRAPSGGQSAQLTSQRVAQLPSRAPFTPQLPQATIRAKKTRKPQAKPHLIANLNGGKDSKSKFSVAVTSSSAISNKKWL